ncbi:MAG: hypothetical protein RL112_271 [Planctomycetota bacterium]|jgi:uncharacterized membrane protein YozB (DUF420 family)
MARSSQGLGERFERARALAAAACALAALAPCGLAREPVLAPPGASEPSVLPFVNACLNAGASVLLVAGLVAIKRGRRELHERLMRAAFLVSTAFLASYLWYHFGAQKELGPTKFHGVGLAKVLYLAMLASHVLLAIVNLPMVLRTLWLAHKERWDDHRRLAKPTFAIWLYVSVTGVLVYLTLYHWNPAP